MSDVNMIYLGAPPPAALAPMAAELNIWVEVRDRVLALADGNPGALVALAGACRASSGPVELATFLDRCRELGLRGSGLYSARKRVGDDALFFVMVWGRDRAGLGL